jgi:GntR family transcriptional repressor for pyruvate dehydrogenase complex
MTEARPPHGRRVHEEIVARIGEMIDSGEFKAGDRLPPERRLAEIFRVSRHSLREALRSLEQQGLVRSHLGDGTYILDRADRAFVEPLAQAIGLGVAKLREIFEFRKLLEPQIASLAASTATTGDLSMLAGLLVRQRQAEAAGEWAAADAAFHLQIARATGNSVIFEVFGQLQETLGESRGESLQNESRRQASLRAHTRILSALQRRDPRLADQKMREHLEEIEQTVFGR